MAELLNPRGCHSQGHYFLELFLKESYRLCRPSHWPEPSEWQVTTEDAVNRNDRLDIVLRCRACGFITVFENKVDAREQDDQIDRYAAWLDKQNKTFLDRNLIFLTPDGRAPLTDTHDKAVSLSYRKHITEWLKCARKKILPKRLDWALEQYLTVVESL